jgi:hypothetical protein
LGPHTTEQVMKAVRKKNFYHIQRREGNWKRGKIQKRDEKYSDREYPLFVVFQCRCDNYIEVPPMSDPMLDGVPQMVDCQNCEERKFVRNQDGTISQLIIHQCGGCEREFEDEEEVFVLASENHCRSCAESAVVAMYHRSIKEKETYEKILKLLGSENGAESEALIAGLALKHS